MKALVGVFNQEKALVGVFSVIVKTGCGTDGSFYSTKHNHLCVKPNPSTNNFLVCNVMLLYCQGPGGAAQSAGHRERRHQGPHQDPAVPGEPHGWVRQ